MYSDCVSVCVGVMHIVFVGFEISMVLLGCKCFSDIVQWFALICVHSESVHQRIVLHCRLQFYLSICGLFNCVRKCADCVLSLRSRFGGFIKFDIVLYDCFNICLNIILQGLNCGAVIV